MGSDIKGEISVKIEKPWGKNILNLCHEMPLNSRSLNSSDIDPHFICAITFPSGVSNLRNGVFYIESSFFTDWASERPNLFQKALSKRYFLPLALSFQGPTH